MVVVGGTLLLLLLCSTAWEYALAYVFMVESSSESSVSLPSVTDFLEEDSEDGAEKSSVQQRRGLHLVVKEATRNECC